jgi:hypothetical protein
LLKCKGAPAPDRSAQAFLSFRQRHRGDGLAIEMEEIEHEKDERAGVNGDSCVLKQAEGPDAVRANAAQFAI